MYDNLDFQRGVQANLNTIQVASMPGMRKELLAFGPPNTTVLVFEKSINCGSVPLPAEEMRLSMKQRYTVSLLLLTLVMVGCSQTTDEASAPESNAFEAQVEEYIQKFPYQDSFEYAIRYTDGDPNKLNIWAFGTKPVLVKAGEDTVVRMNNDTYYKMAFVSLEDGAVVLESNAPSKDRFSSFQLMDDRNVNYQNIIHPDGQYTLYHGDRPDQIQGEAIEVPSNLSVVIVRVELKDKNDPDDVEGAKTVFNGITITGRQPAEFPQVDLLSGFPEDVAAEALRQLDEAFATIPFSQTVVGPGQEPGRDVPYLNHSAGTKGGWGGPDPAHSAYETLFFDKNGDEMRGGKGSYTVTTEEPPVDAFWSITVYDTDRGGFFHPNKDDRYHINNTAAVRNDSGTVTFTFKQTCETSDRNCLEVPAGRFDLVARYYLPHAEIITGEWTLPGIELESE